MKTILSHKEQVQLIEKLQIENRSLRFIISNHNTAEKGDKEHLDRLYDSINILEKQRDDLYACFKRSLA